VLVTAAAAEPLVLKVAEAAPAYDVRTNQPMVTFKLTDASATTFGAFAQANFGRKVDVRINGKTAMSPVIRSSILGGTGQIAGQYTVEQVRDMAVQLNAGAKFEVEMAD
jgi:SecD/SecF fusion protein